MRKLTMTTAIAAAFLCLGAIGADAMTGPGPTKQAPATNYTPKQEAACRGYGRWCGPGYVRACNRWHCWCRPCW
jgi:hypothetical protein